MSERRGEAERPEWTADERIILRALMQRYRSNSLEGDIYRQAIRDAGPELNQLQKARDYLARIEAYRRQRDEQEQLEADRLYEARQEAENETIEQTDFQGRLDAVRAAYQSGRVTEFPDGSEPDEEMIYIDSDHPHPYAVTGDYTDLEWAVIAGLHQAARSWDGAAEDGADGVEGIKHVAGPHVRRNIAMADDEWGDRMTGLTHDLDYYIRGEADTDEERPTDDGPPPA